MLISSLANYGQSSKLLRRRIVVLESSRIHRGFVARWKIETGAGVVEGKQAALKQGRDSNKVFQDGAAPVLQKRLLRNVISQFFHSRGSSGLISEPSPGIFAYYPRRLVFGIVCVIVYGLLDRTTVYLQIWPSISAWYPPVGLSVALLVGIGPAIIPVIVAAGYLAGYVTTTTRISMVSLFFLSIPWFRPSTESQASISGAN